MRQHLANLNMVMKYLCKYKFFVKLYKYSFLYPRITFIGHQETSMGVKIVKEKVLDVGNWLVPTN